MRASIILLIILAVALPAYAQQIPDYDGPPQGRSEFRCNINKKPTNTVNQGPLTAVELQHLGGASRYHTGIRQIWFYEYLRLSKS